MVSDYRALRPSINAATLIEYLADHPEVVSEWEMYSDDKRTSGGWYFQKLGQERIVGRLGSDSRRTDQRNHDSPVEGCAEYILLELDFLASLCGRHQPVACRKTGYGEMLRCNGPYKKARDIRVPADDEGFFYGYGIFETIRVTGGVPWLLDAHLERFGRGWHHCVRHRCPTSRGPTSFTGSSSGADFRTGSPRSRFSRPRANAGAAFSTGDARDGPGICPAAGPHRTRRFAPGGVPARAAIAPQPLQNDELHALRMAGNWAKSRGADDAVLLDSDETVSETSTANHFARVRGTLVRAFTDSALPGTAEKAVIDVLSSCGEPVRSASFIPTT